MRAELKIIPPRPGRTPFYYLRGTYRGTYVERSLGTTVKAVAQAALIEERKRIDRGETASSSGPTWVTAANSYLDHRPEIADCDRVFIARLSVHFGPLPLAKIDQAAIDGAAVALLPAAKPATRNREVYTPISAILRHNGVTLPIKRPKGAQGTPRRHWLRPDAIDRFLDAAWQTHPRFAALCALLYYCGPRLSEALAIQVADVHLDEGFIDVPDTKNGEPQRLVLPPYVRRAIAIALNQPANRTWTDQTLPRTKGSLFCLTKSGALYELFNEVALAAKVEIPEGVSFHIFRHSYGAQMRARKIDLTETGRWTSRAGAAPYAHYEITEAAMAAMTFPGADGAPKLREIG